MNDQSQPKGVYPDALDLLSLYARDVFRNSQGQEIREGMMVQSPKGLGIVISLMNPVVSIQEPSAIISVSGVQHRLSIEDLSKL